jgi:hypothetical protein
MLVYGISWQSKLPSSRRLLVSFIILICLLAPAKFARAAEATPPASADTDKAVSDCAVQLYPPAPPPGFSEIVILLREPKFIWTGDCINQRVSGYGVLDTSNSEAKLRYEGTMLNGMMNGHGMITLPTGETISGDFKDGVIAGTVDYTSTKGMHYQGEWSNTLEGKGTATWPDSSSYTGDWHNGLPSGSGIMKYQEKDNPVYNGAFLNGKRNGHGVIAYDTGLRVEGEWNDDRISGHVLWISSQGDRYDGEFRDAKMNGMGTMVSHTGTRYEGEWKDGAPDGQGTLQRTGSPPYTGVWKHGCFQDGARSTNFAVDASSCSTGVSQP